jgi:hypothetical protein
MAAALAGRRRRSFVTVRGSDRESGTGSGSENE